MPFDALTVAALADELQERCVGGRIQGVFLPAPLAIGLEIYAHHATHFLFASAHPQHARIHLTQGKLSKGSDDVTPMLLLLRKYVRDGRLAAVEHPALERTLSLIITKTDVFGKGPERKKARSRHTSAPRIIPFPSGNAVPEALTLPAAQQSERKVPESGAGPEATDDGLHPLSMNVDTPQPDLELTTVSLIIEVMGRYSNVILVDSSGTVLEAVKHVPAEVNRYRVTLPRHPYVPPPPQTKADPRGVSSSTLQRLLSAAATEPVWQTLMRAFRGISPLAAHEIVFRAAGKADALGAGVAPDALAAALSAMLEPQYTHHWSPTLVYEGQEILDFTPYELRQFGAGAKPAPGISAAIQAYYEQEPVASDYAGLKQEVQRVLDVMRQRVARRQESLLAQEAVGRGADELRTKGEMLLAYASQVQPGQTEITVQVAPDQPALRIALDARLSAVDNAQVYFRRYAHARDAARTIPPLLEKVKLDLAYLDQLALDVEMARTSAEVREVQRALSGAGPEFGNPPGRHKSGHGQYAKLQPLSYTSDDGTEILVGRNARQNDELTFQIASAGDLWLHARGVAGSHVIVRSRGHPVARQTLVQAAELAAAHSAARGSTRVTVEYTQRRHVHRIKGGGPGLVTYSHEKTIQVRPADLGDG
jgi:predicted ribosome quality control (RQC) complex YloA/Tae2 family protein